MNDLPFPSSIFRWFVLLSLSSRRRSLSSHLGQPQPGCYLSQTWIEPMGRWPVCRKQGPHRRLLALKLQIEGRGHRVFEADYFGALLLTDHSRMW